MASKLVLSDAVKALPARRGGALLTHQMPSGAKAHTLQNKVVSTGWGVPVSINAAHSATAKTLARPCARTVAESSVCAAACALAAVVHCSNCLWLTSMRHSARSTASLDDSACVNNWLKCHRPPPTARATSVNALR